LGLGLSSDFAGETNFTLLATHRMTWLNSLGGELRTDVQVGFDNRLRVEFYQPLNAAGRYFVAPRAAAGQVRVDLYSGADRISTYNIGSRIAGLDFGVVFQQFGQIRMGVEGGSVTPKLSTGVGVIGQDGTSYAQGGVRTRLVFDQLDNVNFPRHGWSADVELYNSSTVLGAEATYGTWRAAAGAAYTFGESTARINLAAAGKLGSNPLPAYAQFQWAGSSGNRATRPDSLSAPACNSASWCSSTASSGAASSKAPSAGHRSKLVTTAAHWCAPKS
jgi:NTE family protein